jgi:hypothetical protein
MERLVKARFCLVDGMVSRQVGASALTARWLEASEVVVAGVGGACPGLVVAGRLLGWHDAPGQRGSAGRHPDIRGLGPHVGHTQEGALATVAGRKPRHSLFGDRSCSGGVSARRTDCAPPRPISRWWRWAGTVVRRSSRPTSTRRAPGRSRPPRCSRRFLRAARTRNPGAQALLGFPRPGGDRWGQALLTAGDPHADGGVVLVGPGRPRPVGRAGGRCRPW